MEQLTAPIFRLHQLNSIAVCYSCRSVVVRPRVQRRAPVQVPLAHAATASRRFSLPFTRFRSLIHCTAACSQASSSRIRLSTELAHRLRLQASPRPGGALHQTSPVTSGRLAPVAHRSFWSSRSSGHDDLAAVVDLHLLHLLLDDDRLRCAVADSAVNEQPFCTRPSAVPRRLKPGLVRPSVARSRKVQPTGSRSISSRDVGRRLFWWKKNLARAGSVLAGHCRIERRLKGSPSARPPSGAEMPP